MKKVFKKRLGFSLIEMMIAVSIFSVLVVLIVQIFHMVIVSEKRISNSFTIQEDLKFFTEYVFRDIRMAKKQSGGHTYENYKFATWDEVDEIRGLIYIDAHGRLTTIRLSKDSDSSVNRVLVTKHKGIGSGYLQFTITPANIDILDLKFIIDEPMSGVERAKQPMVTIFIKARTLSDQENTELTLQTSVINRSYDE